MSIYMYFYIYSLYIVFIFVIVRFYSRAPQPHQQPSSRKHAVLLILEVTWSKNPNNFASICEMGI